MFRPNMEGASKGKEPSEGPSRLFVAPAPCGPATRNQPPKWLNHGKAPGGLQNH